MRTGTPAATTTTILDIHAADIATIRIPPMAMPQRDDLIEEIKRADLSLEGRCVGERFFIMVQYTTWRNWNT